LLDRPTARELVGLGVVLYLRSRRTHVPVWSIVAFSAFVTVVTGLVGFDEIGLVVNLDVVLFLVGMFGLVSLAELSGLLSALSAWFIGRFRSRYSVA